MPPVPVAPPEPLALLAPLVDEEICTMQPVHMLAVGAWYEDFSQTTDSEVTHLLGELGPEAGDCPHYTDPTDRTASPANRTK